MKHRLRTRIFSCILIIIIILGGCGKSTVYLDPYDTINKNYIGTNSIDDLYRLNGIANDLCVIEDESLFDPNYVDIGAGAVFDITNQKVLYSKNAFLKLAPASITKIMTALVVLREGNLDDVVTVSDEVNITHPDAWLCKLKPGDTLTLEELLTAMMVYSGNDAAAAIAVHMAGSVESFAKKMNEVAAELGATSTHFMNPHGLDEETHYSTAYDLYLIFNECLKYEKFKEIICMKEFTCTYKNAAGATVTATWPNGNGYLVSKEAPEGITVFGGKTGNTDNAGRCLIILSTKDDGTSYISVVLNAKDYDALYTQMNLLLEKAL